MEQDTAILLRLVLFAIVCPGSATPNIPGYVRSAGGVGKIDETWNGPHPGLCGALER